MLKDVSSEILDAMRYIRDHMDKLSISNWIWELKYEYHSI